MGVSSIESLEYDGIPKLIEAKDTEISDLKLEILKLKNVIEQMKQVLSNY